MNAIRSNGSTRHPYPRELGRSKERHLARRILPFTKVKSSGNAAQKGRTSPVRHFLTARKLQRMFNGRPKIQPRGILSGQDGPTDNLYRPWDELCKMYPGKQLSKKEEKLVAVSALAKEFGELFPDGGYTAGMWRSTLPVSLL